MQVDWSLIKLEYELLHTPPDILARTHRVSESHINYAIQKERWTQVDIPALDLTDLEGVVESAKKRQEILEVLKQQALAPRYIALEVLLVNKTIEAINSIDTTHVLATKQLKDLSDVMEKILGKRLTDSATKLTSPSDLKVIIMNKIDSAPALPAPQLQLEVV